MDKNLHELAAELQKRLPKRPTETLDVVVTVDEEGEYIDCAPAVGDRRNPYAFGGSIYYVEEIVVFAKYHDLDITTHMYDTGAGLRIG